MTATSNRPEARLSRHVPPALQARVLHEALPYLQSVQGKVFVVHCEDHWLSDPKVCAGFGRDVAMLHLVGLRLVLVHGDRQASPLELLRLRSGLVGAIIQQGCRAVGLTSADGGESGLAGGLIQQLHAKGFIPVVMTHGNGASGGSSGAGELAGQLARQLGAEKLLMLCDSPGVLGRDGRVIPTLQARDVAAWTSDDAHALSTASRLRLDIALAAVADGVGSAHIIDGRNDHALLLEVLSNAGEGTTVLPARAPHFLDDSLNYLSRSEDKVPS